LGGRSSAIIAAAFRSARAPGGSAGKPLRHP
jgi:hypothetical protein